jgi:hypothetical protein
VLAEAIVKTRGRRRGRGHARQVGQHVAVGHVTVWSRGCLSSRVLLTSRPTSKQAGRRARMLISICGSEGATCQDRQRWLRSVAGGKTEPAVAPAANMPFSTSSDSLKHSEIQDLGLIYFHNFIGKIEGKVFLSALPF